MKKVQPIIWLLFFSALLLSCGTARKKKVPFTYLHPSTPIMPAWLMGDTTTLNTGDIFPNQKVGVVVAGSTDKTGGLSLQPGLSSDTSMVNQSFSVVSPKNGVLHAVTLVNLQNNKRCDWVLKKAVSIPVTLTYRGKVEKGVFVKGDFNAWNSKSHPLQKISDTVYQTTLSLDPGEYGYQFVADGKGVFDVSNPNRRSNGFGGENSVLTVAESRPVPHITAKWENQALHLHFEQPLKTEKLHVIALWDNQIIYQTVNSQDKNRVVQWINPELTIPAKAKTLKRSFIRVFCATEFVHGNDLLIPLEYGIPVTDSKLLSREDLEKTVMYFAFVDRFNNGDKSNDMPLNHPLVTQRTNFQGGDLQGITQKIQEAYFDSMGMNALWISPISKNPKGAWGDFPDPHVKFSGYHGYWPVSNTLIDERFGNATALKEMLSEAHNRNNNVYLDYVAHHVHKEHPIYKQHPDWVTPLYLPDGRMNTELWDEQRLTTWFDTFLPTLDLGRPEVASYMVDSALYWLSAFDFDGFRHDATKHIPDNFTRLLTAKIRREIEPARNQRIFQIGETYGNTKLIGSYLGHGLLDAQFDFNLYDAMLRTFAWNGSFTGLATEQLRSIGQYGHHHLMGNITGNQDKPRFMSYADGTITGKTAWNEGKKMGHLGDLSLKNDSAYQKFLHFYTWLFAAPGIPVVYYGDEIGMTGGNDPGNRNMMRFDSLTSQQSHFKHKVAELGKLRTGSMALCYGDYQVLSCNDSQVVISRRYLNEMAIMAINRSKNNLELPDLKKMVNDLSIKPKAVWSNMDKIDLWGIHDSLLLKPNQSAILIYTYN
jgi:glycosidase